MPESAEVVYRAQDGDPVNTVWRGVRFTKDVPVTVTDPELIAAARVNPHFDVDGEDKAAERARKVREAEKVHAEGILGEIRAKGAEMEERQEREVNELEARHQKERDDFENANNARYNAAAAVLNDEPVSSEPQPGNGDGSAPPKDTVQSPSDPNVAGAPKADPMSDSNRQQAAALGGAQRADEAPPNTQSAEPAKDPNAPTPPSTEPPQAVQGDASA